MSPFNWITISAKHMRLLSCYLFYICILLKRLHRTVHCKVHPLTSSPLIPSIITDHLMMLKHGNVWSLFIIYLHKAWPDLDPLSHSFKVWTFAQRCHNHFSQSESQWKMLQMFPWVKMRNKSPYRTCILLYVLIGEKWRYYVLRPDC